MRNEIVITAGICIMRELNEIFYPRHLIAAATALANSLVSSKLDYCNSLNSTNFTISSYSSTHFKLSTHYYTNIQETLP